MEIHNIFYILDQLVISNTPLCRINKWEFEMNENNIKNYVVSINNITFTHRTSINTKQYWKGFEIIKNNLLNDSEIIFKQKS